MPRLELSFASGEDSLSVRRFSVREGMSALFEVSVWAHSPSEEIDLESIVGRPASLRIEGDMKLAHHSRRTWSGVCSYIEQVQAEATGLSTYHLRILPALWPLTHRRGHRIFQHQSVPEIVTKILAEWDIDPIWRVGAGAHPRLAYRVQYGESDLEFICRMLEEAGIAFVLSDAAGDRTELILSDRFHAGELREGGPIPYIDNPNQATEREFVSQLKISHEVRPGKVTIRDFDFRRKPDYKLVGQAGAGSEERYEHHYYLPGSFQVEGQKGGDTPAADDRGVARADEKAGKSRAERYLAAERAGKRAIGFETSALDLRPGTLFSISQHARPDLAPDKRLLVTEASIEGAHDSEWKIRGQAVFAAHPYAPARKTPKPRVHGVQSAVVVGPRGEEIHTDEFGRVRVQFHWDREGTFDDGSSCWMRVSQGWAGGGFGLLAIPRVGQEVLVGFLDGDPDEPLVVGRVFNNTSRAPYKLPEHKTRSSWKSDSSPGSDGFNEIMFEDAKGRELVHVRAERDLTKLVKGDEAVSIGRSRTKVIGVSESEAIGLDKTTAIGGHRTVTVGGDHTAQVGARHAVTMAQPEEQKEDRAPTSLEMVDRKITLTTGEATLTLEGPNITLAAAASILLDAMADITVTGRANIHVAAGASVHVEAEDGELTIQGGPVVRINPILGGQKRHAEQPEHFAPLPMDAPPDEDVDANIELAEDNVWFQSNDPSWFENQVAPGGPWHPDRWGAEFKDFGHFHYGVVGCAAGVPEGVLLRQAGKRHREEHGVNPERGHPGNGLWGGEAPYGNEPRHVEMMTKGFEHYNRNYR